MGLPLEVQLLRLCTGLIPELETKIPHVAKKKKKKKGSGTQEKEDVFRNWELGTHRVGQTVLQRLGERLDSGGDEL